MTILPQNHNSRITVDNEFALVQFAKSHYGITQTADFLLKEPLASGELVQLFSGLEAEGYPIFAIYPSRKQLSAKVRKFIEFLSERALV